MKRIILLLAMCCCGACLRTDEIKAFDGYVDSSEMRANYGQPELHLIVGKGMLWLSSLVMWMDGDVSGLLSGVDAARIEVYQLNHNPAPALNAVRNASKRLQAQGWEPVVSVNDENEQTRILVKVDEDSIKGVVVMSVESGHEATFINVVGDIAPDQIMKLSRKMDINAGI